MGDLQALAAMAEPLSGVATSLTAIASGLAGIALALSTLETEKINELKGLVMTTAFAAPMVAASGAITELITGITGGGDQQSSNAALEAKLDELIAAVREGGDVFIDGNKAGNAMLLSSYKSS
jgi:low affinity Fe/Cu permease